MHKLLILFLILIALFFVFQAVKKPAANATGVSGTGPGYIPAFQGYPEVGVSGA
jgi:hypothetical protein